MPVRRRRGLRRRAARAHRPSTHCPFKGDASYWTVRAGDRVERERGLGLRASRSPGPLARGHAALYSEAGRHVVRRGGAGAAATCATRTTASTCTRARARCVVRARRRGRRPVGPRRSCCSRPGSPSRVYVPRADVAAGALAPAEKRPCARTRASATYWSVAGIADGAGATRTSLARAPRKVQGHVSSTPTTSTRARRPARAAAA